METIISIYENNLIHVAIQHDKPISIKKINDIKNTHFKNDLAIMYFPPISKYIDNAYCYHLFINNPNNYLLQDLDLIKPIEVSIFENSRLTFFYNYADENKL
jgi:hypothetical protein